MSLRSAAITFLALGVVSTLPLVAQERGYWKPASKTAQSITGDVALGGDKITINFFTTTVAEIRPLKPEELAAAFSDASADGAGSGSVATNGGGAVGHLWRLSIAGDKRFLHKNTLCGTDETQWMATYVAGKTMEIAFFSNAAPPVFTLEALRDSPNLCGTFVYGR